jgi:hypothetical protein
MSPGSVMVPGSRQGDDQGDYVLGCFAGACYYVTSGPDTRGRCPRGHALKQARVRVRCRRCAWEIPKGTPERKWPFLVPECPYDEAGGHELEPLEYCPL